MKRNRMSSASRIVLMIFAAIGAAILFGWLVMLLWNALMPDIFNLGTITFWQALGLLVLAKIFFGFGGGGRGKRRWRRPIPQEHWASMTPEEREKFKQEWRNRCGWYEKKPAQTQSSPPETGTQSI